MVRMQLDHMSLHSFMEPCLLQDHEQATEELASALLGLQTLDQISSKRHHLKATTNGLAIDWFSMFFARRLGQHKTSVATALHCNDKQIVLYVSLGSGNPNILDERASQDLLYTLRALPLQPEAAAKGEAKLLECSLRHSLPCIALALEKFRSLKEEGDLYARFESALSDWETQRAQTPDPRNRKHDASGLRIAFKEILQTMDGVIQTIEANQPTYSTAIAGTILGPLTSLWRSMAAVFWSAFVQDQFKTQGRHFGHFDYKRFHWRLWRAHSCFTAAKYLARLFLKARELYPSAALQISWVPEHPTTTVQLKKNPVEFLSDFVEKHGLSNVKDVFDELRETELASSWAQGTNMDLRSSPETRLVAYLAQHDVQVFGDLIGMNTSIRWVSQQYLKITVPSSMAGRSWSFSSTCSKISPQGAAPPHSEAIIGVIEEALKDGLQEKAYEICTIDRRVAWVDSALADCVASE